MGIRRWQFMVVPIVLAGMTLVGCAKRPAATQVSAPSPTGSAVAGPAAAQAGTGAGLQPGSGAGTQSGGTSAVQSGSGGTSGAGGPTGAGGAGGTGGTGSSALQSGSGAAGAGPTGAAAATPPATTARPRPAEFAENAGLADIYFDFDQSNIRADAAKTLDANAVWMKSNANHLILIEGHCDERGTNEYNLALGERRARSTLNYLVAQGVQASRITIISYGEERPTCTEKTEACWAKNRRAHFLVKAQ